MSLDLANADAFSALGVALQLQGADAPDPVARTILIRIGNACLEASTDLRAKAKAGTTPVKPK